MKRVIRYIWFGFMALVNLGLAIYCWYLFATTTAQRPSVWVLFLAAAVVFSGSLGENIESINNELDKHIGDLQSQINEFK